MKQGKLLADTDFLFALVNTGDTHHNKAVDKLKEYNNALIYITALTIPETATVISYKIDQPSAALFLQSARQKDFINLPFNIELIKQTDELFIKQKKKGVSWIDCYNIVCIKYFALDGILSFDLFYRKNGIKMF